MAKVKPTKAEVVPVSNVHLDLQTELYRTFDFFNTRFCDSKLPRPVITVATRGRTNAHGWFCHSSWRMEGADVLHEIQMCAESFKRSPNDSIGTLVHEMAHLKNFVDNKNTVVDCTPQQRHNKKFQVTAEFFGLTVTSSKRFGPAHTTPGEVALKAIEDLKPNVELYKIYRDGMNSEKEKKAKPSKLKPVMVDEETKQNIEKAAEELGMTQKEFTKAAVDLMRGFKKNAESVADQIFADRQNYKNAAEIEAVIVDGMEGGPISVTESEDENA